MKIIVWLKPVIQGIEQVKSGYFLKSDQYKGIILNTIYAVLP